ncbi:Leucine Rich Repeat family protein [Histomonas meleagridis]|uniref:Leucine Rich Repeat family protein n=1 Tax=Histomonas meleagridis TaxID=135588 RepID=UPI00355A5905|nr:Leucine Rich Repeat family protein [Histomonas meleagridis]KAH0804583.1 Leucine Rich Repeat family protein [Histomonas meleagridis]
MSRTLSRKVQRPLYEFQRTGPIARQPAGHKPDLTLSIQKSHANDKNSNDIKHITKTKNVNTLDNLFLIYILGYSEFEKCTSINASSQNLKAIDLESLKLLVNLQTADFSDNNLPLEPFSILPSLEELDLSCNSIIKFEYQSCIEICGDSEVWNSLYTLNLSFNNLELISINDLQKIPHLTNLDLSHNSISSLPSNLIYFSSLTTLNLTSNLLNTDQTFFSLSTIPSLQTLILDDNDISYIPILQTGFTSLSKISLKNNKLENSGDFISLIDLEHIKEVDIIGNPILLRPKQLNDAREAFTASNIDLIFESTLEKNKPLNLPLRTVSFDPLTLPRFTKAHKRALNRKIVVPEAGKQARTSTTETYSQPDDNVFMTSVGAKSETSEIIIEPTPLPNPNDTSEEEIKNIWKEIPVVNYEMRKKLDVKHRLEFVTAFNKLQFLVNHPDMRLIPKDSKESETNSTENEFEISQDLIQGKPETKTKKNTKVSTQLEADTEYTKEEIQNMLRSMEERLEMVERDLKAADESGQMAVEIAFEQKNFTQLHKQYEAIRSELINTING